SCSLSEACGTLSMALVLCCGCQVPWNWNHSCELPCGYWELILGPLKEQSMMPNHLSSLIRCP
ncbi:hypothetical protein LEMLEM_LOCUS10996, partial [Lemmus lemmus]